LVFIEHPTVLYHETAAGPIFDSAPVALRKNWCEVRAAGNKGDKVWHWERIAVTLYVPVENYVIAS
jgi:hypothetical protein